MTNCQKQILEFLGYLEKTKLRTARTVRNYHLYLKRFCNWSEENKIKLKDLDTKVINSYREYLKGNKKLVSSKTRNYHLIALRSLVRYLDLKKKITVPVYKIRLEKTDTKNLIFLDKEEKSKLFEQISKEGKDKIIQARDRVMLELFSCTGLKVSELVRLLIDDINTGKKKLIFSGRDFHLTNSALKHIKDYLGLRGRDKVKYLFVSHDRANRNRKDFHMSERTAQRMVERLAQNAGIDKKVTPQVLRNTFLLNCLQNDNDLEEIKEKFGFISDNFLYNLSKLK